MLSFQYELTKSSRNVLLEFCSKIKNEELNHVFENFGRGSIRNILVHISDTYYYWLNEFAQNLKPDFQPAESYSGIDEIRNYFDDTDKMVLQFLGKFRNDFTKQITGIALGKEIHATPLKLFTHVITHEYHHKGQILSMGRHLDYTPPDTDALR